MRWGTDTVKAVHDAKCPNVELTVGWQNTCLQAAPQQQPDPPAGSGADAA